MYATVFKCKFSNVASNLRNSMTLSNFRPTIHTVFDLKHLLHSKKVLNPQEKKNKVLQINFTFKKVLHLKL